MTGLVVILAILLLGGGIAVIGDRLGMKVGKARLSLFGLRPRQTATVITILTGTLIAASTFGLLFAIDDQLRRGVFDYEEIQDEKRQAEAERDIAQQQRIAARQRLTQINRSLRQSIAQQNRTKEQLRLISQQEATLRTEIRQLETVRRQQIAQRDREILRRAKELQQLEADRRQQVTQRDQEIAERERSIRQLEADRKRQIAQRDQEIAEREEAIAEREALLSQLENQRLSLEQEVQTLEEEFRRLRLGNPALLRNQTLASGVVRIVSPTAAPQAVNDLLRQANRVALQRVRPGENQSDAQVIRITNSQVDQLIEQIQGGGDYVVSVLSAGNYVVGEPCVLAGETCIQVYVTAALNQIVFDTGEVIATTSVNPLIMNNERLVERMNLLIAAAQFRARQAGIVSDMIQIADGRSETVIQFFEELKHYNQPVEIQAVASETTYTAGPVRLELLAVQNDQILFSTQSQ